MPKVTNGEYKPWFNELCSKKCIGCSEDRVPTESPTLRNHAYNIAWLARRMDGFDSEKLLVPEPEKVIDYLSTAKVSCERKSNSYSAMKVWHRCHEQANESMKYAPALLESKCERKKGEMEQKRSAKENKHWIDHKCFKKIVNELVDRTKAVARNKKYGERWSKQEYIDATMAFITLFHSKYPLRNELHSVRWGETEWEANDNYLDMDAREIVLNKYKTSKYHGPVRFKLTRGMWQLWRWIYRQQVLLGLPSKYVILGKHWRKLSSQGIANFVSTELGKFEDCKGKRVTLMRLRHIKITHFLKNDRPLKKHAQFARNCLHTMSQSHRYRRIS